MNRIKILTLMGIALAITFANTAQAGGTGDGMYAGVAIVGSAVLVDSGNTTDELDGDSAVSGGVFAGYKHKIYHGIFASGEVFYHHTAQDERYDNGDILEVDAQYGAKIHLGYEWDWGSIYAIAGAAHLGYDLTQNNVYVEDSSFQPLFGLGTSYQFNEKLSAQLEFINTGDDVNIAGDQEKSLSMMTLLLGVSYHF